MWGCPNIFKLTLELNYSGRHFSTDLSTVCSRHVLCDVACTLAICRYSTNMGESSSEYEDVELESNYSSSHEWTWIFGKGNKPTNILENLSDNPVLNVGFLWLWGYKNVNLLGDKSKDVKCITSNSEFHILCLNKIVLETDFTRHRRYQNKYSEIKNITSK